MLLSLCGDLARAHDPGNFFDSSRLDSRDVIAFRLSVVETLAGIGIPLQKADGMRVLLERTGKPLTDSSHLRTLVPKALARERLKLQVEYHDQFISTTFDGTTRLGEAMNFVTRWCDADMVLYTRLTLFKTTKKSMSGEELAPFISDWLDMDHSTWEWCKQLVLVGGYGHSSLGSAKSTVQPNTSY